MSKVTQDVRLLLPNRLVGPVDLSRTIRELTNLDDSLHQANLRTPGRSVSLPKTTRTLEDLAEINKISLLEKRHREVLLEALKIYQKKAPVIHMSFTVEPSAAVLAEIIVWLRKNIKENVLLDVGLQPTIIVGCVARTSNKVFDMSLRNNISKQAPMLMKYIGGQQA